LSTDAVLELSGPPSASNGQALSQPGDADLVAACINWLAAAPASTTDADESSVRAEALFAAVPGDFHSVVTALLAMRA